MKIQYLLTKSSILINIDKTEKADVLSMMSQFIASLYALEDAGRIAGKILEREAVVSTGIGCGVAIPHARLENIDRIYMVAASSQKGIEFDSIDGEPVHIIFMILSPANTTTVHTELLSSLSSIMSDENVRKRLVNAQETQIFLDVLTGAENESINKNRVEV
jgi:mannitol/fructose-specific phosphotransferase system IIA component (Ntr-type)